MVEQDSFSENSEEQNKQNIESDDVSESTPSKSRMEWASEFLEELQTTGQKLPRYHGSWYRNRTLQQEAHRTIEGQVDWIREIDEKATKTLRFNTILLGLIVPALSFAVQYEIVSEIRAFYTLHIALGVVCLLGSTALAGVTYTSSNIEAGVSSSDIRTAKSENLSDKEIHDTLIDSYEQWIESNRSTIFWNTILITLTILLMISALVFLSLGVASTLLGGLPENIRYGAYVGLFVVLFLSQTL